MAETQTDRRQGASPPRCAQRVADAVAELKAQHGVVPGLAVVLVGDDPASEVYVRNKGKATRRGRHASASSTSCPPTTSEAELLALVDELNADPAVHGILVQLPLPRADRASSKRDRHHRPGQGRRRLPPDQCRAAVERRAALVPCTPYGCLMLLQGGAGQPRRRRGAGDRPLQPRRQADRGACCWTRTAPSPWRIRSTRDLPGVARRADILVAAIGRPRWCAAVWIKPGATVIDVGINRVCLRRRQDRLVGDVAFAEAQGSPARSRRCRAASGR